MPGFPLFNLHPILLEQIINKLEGKSYLRLQQTCHGVKVFVENNQNIRVYMEGQYVLRFIDGAWQLNRFSYWAMKSSNGLVGNPINLDLLYGIRLAQLTNGINMAFDRLCDSLKRNRITCRILTVGRGDFDRDYPSPQNSGVQDYSETECSTLLNILKPRETQWCAPQPNFYETIYQSNTVKRVHVTLADGEKLLTSMERLLSAFPEVVLTVDRCSDPVSRTHSILQMVSSKAFRNMRIFGLIVNSLGELPLTDDLEQKLRKGLDIEFIAFQVTNRKQKLQDDCIHEHQEVSGTIILRRGCFWTISMRYWRIL